MNPWLPYVKESEFDSRLTLCRSDWLITDAAVFAHFQPFICLALILFILFVRGPKLDWRSDFDFEEDAK